MKWTKEEEKWLADNYPYKGQQYCAEVLNRTAGSIRQKSSDLGLSLCRNSDFWKDFQARAAKSKVGKKRPEHSQYMKQLCDAGKLPQMTKKSDAQKQKISQRSKEWYANNEHPRGFLGRTHSEETRKVLGEKSKSYWCRCSQEEIDAVTTKKLESRKRNGNWYAHVTTDNAYSRTKSGKRPDLNSVFFRSTTEANYARYLKLLGIEYRFEDKCFFFKEVKRGTQSYMPDFYLPDMDIYVEVKGWLDPKSKVKLRRFRKYYPDTFSKLIIVKQGLSKKSLFQLKTIGFTDEQIVDFKSVEKLKPLIDHWE